MAVTLAGNIGATQQEVTLSVGLIANPGDLFRLGDEVVEFGGYRPGMDSRYVSLRRGRAGTIPASHASGVALKAVTVVLTTSADEDPPSPFADDTADLVTRLQPYFLEPD
jgi:hypothetical protein